MGIEPTSDSWDGLREISNGVGTAFSIILHLADALSFNLSSAASSRLLR
jgi:hypothetical protein